MEKKLLRIGLLSAAIMAITACSKEEDNPVEEQNAPAVHYATVILSKEDATKTAVVEGETQASYVWTEGDEEYLHVYENGIEGEIQSIQYGDGYATATITVSFTGTPTAPYTYSATYGKTMSGEGHPLIRADQKPTASSFDPAADVMISKATADVTNLGARATMLSFTMGRVVSVNKMTLTGLATGELVSKVEFTLGSNFLGGYYSDGAYNSASAKLTAIYETPLAVGADGKFPVYFTCAPVDAASIESVVVTTDQNVYTKPGSAFSGKSISFAVGTMKRFNMGMSGCGVPVVQPASNDFTLVQSQDNLVSGGTYIIVGNHSTLAGMGSQSSNNRSKVDVTADNNVINIEGKSVATFTISSVSGGYTIQDNSSSNYLYDASTNSNNYLRSRADVGTDNLAVWTISVSSGVASINNVGYSNKPVMCYNSSASVFACYSSITNFKTLSLYKQDVIVPALLTPTNLTTEYSNDGTVHIEWDAVSGAASYTVTCTGQTTKTGVTECYADFNNIITKGTYTITVTAISGNQNVILDSDSASIDVYVNKGTLENPYSASEAKIVAGNMAQNTDPSEQSYVSGIVSQVDSYYSKYSSITYYISDDGTTTNQFKIYSGKGLNGAGFSAVTDLAVGDRVVVLGDLYNYNGTPEINMNSQIVSLSSGSSSTATATVTTGQATAISDTQATLAGSYSGATGTVSERGFYYGTVQGGQGTKVTVSGTGDSFSKTLTGLTSNTTYYYKAYIIEDDVVVYGSEESFSTSAVATATVTTLAASSITSSSAQLNGEFSGASGSIYETGFYWGTSQGSLTNQVTTDGTNATSGSFYCSIGGQIPLSANTTYYFKAYVLEFNATTNNYEERVSNTVLSFTTSSVSQAAWQNYLNDYGMPNVSSIVTGLRQSGTYSDRDDKWYSVNTSNSNRQIAIHTYSTGSPTSSETLNYVVLYDGSKYAPVWTYHVMNSYYWPDNNAGRNDSWMDDPAISLTQQGGLDNASTVGYSRGHLVASDYRQTNVKQNKQTFYHSNQAPQWQNSFNSGIWSTLEGRVKTMTPSGTTTMLYVVTGVLYEGTVSNNQVTSSTIPTKTSGSLNVPIPSHFYKCVMKCTFSDNTITGASGIAFVYTNEAHSGNYYNSTFVTSIDAIEQRAGFDFFSNVPTSLQNSAESNTNHYWFTGQGSSTNTSGSITDVNDNEWGDM